MPHTCTNCGRAFADGSKEMLSGCPDCGGNKFQFRPSGSSPDETTASESSSSPAESTGSDADAPSSSGAVGRAASTVKGWVGSRDRQANRTRRTADESAADSSAARTTDTAATKASAGASKPSSDVKTEASSPSDPAVDSRPDAAIDPGEDRAQASARSDVVPEDELPEKPAREDSETVEKPPDENQPSLDELREELNSQFESIKVVEPGQYELNLMELYERDEYIIALKENGRYVIQVPDSWAGSGDN
ncbi:OapC/ArvC family zinc-ribbon domain-containing protein [Haladaptatus caseinilyticus]|uniref:OapC/ArvC family zinc-ribbon domain-containing protein n=1 Tax=Haladaptatus caseinilyticus TaxID=2993314 RepID=UPI00224B94AF|nr:Zn-ribbon containing protein [Haladaptatus caseinilyticus]